MAKNSVLENVISDMRAANPTEDYKLTGKRLDLVLTVDPTGRPEVVSMANRVITKNERIGHSLICPIPLLFVTMSEITNSHGDESWIPNDGSGDGYFLGFPDEKTA